MILTRRIIITSHFLLLLDLLDLLDFLAYIIIWIGMLADHHALFFWKVV